MSAKFPRGGGGGGGGAGPFLAQSLLVVISRQRVVNICFKGI